MNFAIFISLDHASIFQVDQILLLQAVCQGELETFAVVIGEGRDAKTNAWKIKTLARAKFAAYGNFTPHLLALNLLDQKLHQKFPDFMNELVSAYPGKELHVVLDNLNTHKPKEDRWLESPSQRPFSFYSHPQLLAQPD
jgi:hypothetical protein